jgi:hypothetical protein
MFDRRAGLVALGAVALLLAGCGGEAETMAEAPATTEPPPTTTQEEPGTTETAPPQKPEAKPLPGLPAWTAGYRGWTKLNAVPLPPRDSDPHLGTKNVFASTRAKDGVFPVGTIIIKEGFRPGKDFIGLIATMRKIEGADPEHNDWVWVEWARDEATDPLTELASGSVCWSCHVGAEDKDYVFTNG